MAVFARLLLGVSLFLLVLGLLSCLKYGEEVCQQQGEERGVWRKLGREKQGRREGRKEGREARQRWARGGDE